MKKSLSLKESIIIGSMLFGMFFGAGNLIFPVHMGQLAGTNSLKAAIGFIITGVGLPLLGVACLGASRKDSLFDLASLVGDKYKYLFTILLYLTIGPFFAIPRCATTSFGIMTSLLSEGNVVGPRFIFTLVFFAIALLLALKPSGIMNYIGKIINPIFLVFLFLLIIISFANPMLNGNTITPQEAYATQPFFRGFIEGYNTMDAIASLAFGITVITVIRNLGVTREADVAMSTIKAGAIGCGFMAIIYLLTTYMGTMSRGVYETSSNGTIALSQISSHYFGSFGVYILLITVTLACFKTSVALIVSCSEMFNKMFPKVSLVAWTFIFTIFSFVVSNFGLDAIITYAVPVLMFLYPLTITIILLALFGKAFNFDKRVFATTTIFAFISAIFDFIVSFPKDSFIPASFIDNVAAFAQKSLPFFSLGLGWLVPSIIGLIVGLIIHITNKKA